MFGGGAGPALAVPVLERFAACVTRYEPESRGYGRFAAKNACL
jgi:hypothetical protein